MKVLIVASGNAGYVSPFILDQAEALKKNGIEIDFFLIQGKGSLGYLKNYKFFLNKISSFRPNIIHAHYGLSGLFSNLQRRVQVVTSFHGSDVNDSKVRFFSRLAYKLSARSIFISSELARKLNVKNPIIIPCGVDFSIFYPVDRKIARQKLNFPLKANLVLFSSSFSNTVKNYPLAKEALSKITNNNIKLVELKGYSRDEVALLMNAVNVVLLTSFSEGSPQFIKEAMSCNVPIVSVDVGDVRNVINNTDGCYIAERSPLDLSLKIQKALDFNNRTNGRQLMEKYDNIKTAKRIITVYYSIS